MIVGCRNPRESVVRPPMFVCVFFLFPGGSVCDVLSSSAGYPFFPLFVKPLLHYSSTAVLVPSFAPASTYLGVPPASQNSERNTETTTAVFFSTGFDQNRPQSRHYYTITMCPREASCVRGTDEGPSVSQAKARHFLIFTFYKRQCFRWHQFLQFCGTWKGMFFVDGTPPPCIVYGVKLQRKTARKYRRVLSLCSYLF